MLSTYHLECKFCESKKDFRSTWLPVDVLEAMANMWISFHVIRHHPNEISKKRFLHITHQCFWSIAVIIIYILLTIMRIVFYPLWWLLDKLYC